MTNNALTPTPITPEALADLVCKNAKSGKWLSATYSVKAANRAPVAVGIKAHGLWVQRIECCGLVDGVPGQKTQKALKAQLVDLLTRMIDAL